jgi:hypothetical protein
LKTPVIVFALVVAALSVMPAGNPSHAGTVTYDFVEGPGAPNPGEIGATITCFSPPVSATSRWNTDDASSIEGIVILDSGLFLDGFTGTFIPLLVLNSDISSTEGPFLSSAEITDPSGTHAIGIGQDNSIFVSATTAVNVVTGSWTVSASVPEPASAVQAGIASATGLALAAFRKRKEARRQRPAGPLHANQ